MAPSNSSNDQPNGSSSIGKQQFKFVFRDQEYDCTSYAEKHPGGVEFFTKQAEEKKDLTEYFLALHSQKAEKILKSFPVLGKTKQTEESILYESLYRKVVHLIPNDYWKDIALGLGVAILFFIGCFTSNFLVALFCIFTSQIVSGWLCHSWAHGRDGILNKFVDWYSPLFAGVSTNWWNRKHNLHHMFTNVYGKDEDISHQYTKLVYGFLYLKWKFDSIMFDYKSPRILPLILHLIFCFQQNIIVFFICQYIVGFVAAIVLVGNHENEMAFQGKHGLTFIKHQLITSRDYDYHGPLWLVYMGGMQYQAVHHLFPQIPFYNLREVKRIIGEELPKHNLAIKTDSIM